MPKARESEAATALVAGLLAWAIPGAGHIFLRRRVRGGILCVCITGLFWAGVAVGGVFSVDPLKQRWWFAAQMGTGASGVVSWYRQQRARGRITARLGMRPTPPAGNGGDWEEAYTGALVDQDLDLNYPADTVARTYSGVAGMLNLMAIFDAMMLAALGRFGEPPPEKKPPGEEDEE